MNAHGDIKCVNKEKGKIFLANGKRVKPTEVKTRINKRYYCNSLISDYELGHIMMVNQAQHERLLVNVM